MVEPEEAEACQNCRFWMPSWLFKKQQRYASEAKTMDTANPRNTSGLRSSSAKGLCRRYAPQAGALTSVWMETKSEDWCGDYDRAKES